MSKKGEMMTILSAKYLRNEFEIYYSQLQSGSVPLREEEEEGLSTRNVQAKSPLKRREGKDKITEIMMMIIISPLLKRVTRIERIKSYGVVDKSFDQSKSF